MAAQRDYYEILSVGRDADGETIKKAYRKLAIQCHPDRHPDNTEAEERFKELSEAYSVLSDPGKRQLYDQFGHAGVSGNGNFTSGFDFANSFSDVFGDLFQDFFGMGRQGRHSRGIRGEDLRYRLPIEFDEAAFGVEKEITYPRHEECERCLGDGAEPGHSPTPCKVCDGKGEVRYQQAFFTMARTCPNCGGRGRVVEDPCRSCHGEGITTRDRTLTVKVPPGVDDGTRLRIRGEGDNGRAGGANGDLFVQLEVSEHPFFVRDGHNIICDVPVKMEMAALGGSVHIPTLDGTMDLKVPAGTQPGQVFHFRGKGIPRLQGGGRGDQYVRVTVEIPSRLSRKQKQLLEEVGQAAKPSSYKAVTQFSRRMDKLGGT